MALLLGAMLHLRNCTNKTFTEKINTNMKFIFELFMNDYSCVNGVMFGRDNGVMFGRDNGVMFGRDNGMMFGRDNGVMFGRDNGVMFGRDNGMMFGLDPVIIT